MTRRERVLRRAARAYARAIRPLAGLLPEHDDAQAVDTFDAMQRDALTSGGWSAVVACWAAEARAVIALRWSMSKLPPFRSAGALFAGAGHDLRDAWRAARRAPASTAIICLTLALGVGVNTAAFSVIDALFFKALPYADADRLVQVAEWPRAGGNYTAAPLMFHAWKERAAALMQVEARVAASFVYLGGADPEQLAGASVTPGYFDLIGIPMARGRGFTPADAAPGAPCALVISHRLWATALASDPAAIGRELRMSGGNCTVIGVLPPDTVFERAKLDMFSALGFTAAAAASNGRYLAVIGRLAPDATLERARRDLNAITASVNATRGRAGDGWTATITPWRDAILRADTRTLAWSIFGAVTLVLLVACVNVAGLSLARTLARRRETAVRVALGAGRWRTLRALAIESLMLAALGETAALIIGIATLRVIATLLPPGAVPAEAVASLDARAVAFASAISITAALLFGTLPAWRGAGVGIADALRTESRGATGSRATARLHGALLVAELALAMILVSGAAVLAMSFERLVRVDPGFAPDRVLTLKLSLPPARYASDSAAAAFFDKALAEIRAVPGVANASAVTSLPLGGWLYGTSFSIDELPPPPVLPSTHIQSVSDGHFATLGIPLVRGRDFTAHDDAASTRVAIVNETFVRKFLPGGDLGRHIRATADGSAPPYEIVGVIADVKTSSLADKALATPEMYVPYRQEPNGSMFVAVRAATPDVRGLEPGIRAALKRADPELPATSVLPMRDRLDLSVRMPRFRTGLAVTFAAIAAALACIGVYGVRSRAVAARRREMGIRLAMGARPSQVIGLIVGQSAGLIGVGLGIGAAGAIALTRTLQQWFFATRVTDPLILGGSMLLLGGAALAAAWIPARRAGRVDPLQALRQD